MDEIELTTDSLDNLMAHSPRIAEFARELASTGATKTQIEAWIQSGINDPADIALEGFLRSHIGSGCRQEIWVRRLAAWRSAFYD